MAAPKGCAKAAGPGPVPGGIHSTTRPLRSAHTSAGCGRIIQNANFVPRRGLQCEALDKISRAFCLTRPHLGGRGPPTATRPARPPNKPNERPGHRHAPNETSGEGRGRGAQEGQDAAPSPANQHAHRRPPKQTGRTEPRTEGEVAAGVMVARRAVAGRRCGVPFWALLPLPSPDLAKLRQPSSL